MQDVELHDQHIVVGIMKFTQPIIIVGFKLINRFHFDQSCLVHTTCTLKMVSPPL